MRIIICLIIAASLASCKSNKPLINHQNDDVKSVLLEQLVDSTSNKKWFSAKAKVFMKTSDINGGGTMNIRIKRDSIIWFNFKKLSVEGLRGQITPHDFALIYRRENKYEKGSLVSLLDHYNLPFGYEELQGYLMGSLPAIDPLQMKYIHQKEYHYLNGNTDKYKLSFIYDRELNLKGFSITDENGRKLSVEVDKKNEELGIYESRKMFFTTEEGHAGVLEINLSNIEFDVPKKIPFSIPDHYTSF